MAMNRYNYLYGIALGKIPIEESKIELTELDYKIIEEAKQMLEDARARGKTCILHAPEDYDFT